MEDSGCIDWSIKRAHASAKTTSWMINSSASVREGQNLPSRHLASMRVPFG